MKNTRGFSSVGQSLGAVVRVHQPSGQRLLKDMEPFLFGGNYALVIRDFRGRLLLRVLGVGWEGSAVSRGCCR